LKLIDFGIAQRIKGACCHVVKGTPMFMAPEMLLGRGYNTSADLWSLGICLYEFVVGDFPFGQQSRSTVQIFQEVVRAQLKFPTWFEQLPENRKPKETVDLIKGLLTKDPAMRLGAGAQRHQAIKDHKFFEGFPWDDLIGRLLEPPHRPLEETYAEDKEESAKAAKEAASTGKSPPTPEAASAGKELPTLQEEEAATGGIDTSWVDPNPGWDEDF